MNEMNEWMDEIEYEHDNDWEATIDYLDGYNDYLESEQYD